MQASSLCTPTKADNGTIFVALELSQRTWLVTMHSPDRDKISRHKVTGGEHVALVALIEQVRERAAGKLGTRPAVVSCYEAGYDGFWLHRLLTAGGGMNHVFDPASIAVEQRGRRAKTDRIDGEQLLRTLMAHCRGEPRVVRIVQVPRPDQEDARRDTRERDRLSRNKAAMSIASSRCCGCWGCRWAIRAGATGWRGWRGSGTGKASRCRAGRWLSSSASMRG